MTENEASTEEFDSKAMLRMKWNVPCYVNGEEFNLEGVGEGNGAEGTMDVAVKFTALPAGFDPYIVTAWTSSDSLLFMQEQGGARNLLGLTGGAFRVLRAINLGDGNYLNCIFEKRRDGDTIYTTGVVRGVVNVPPIGGVLTMREELDQADAGVIFGKLDTVFATEDGDSISPQVNGLYAYGTERRMPFPQMRTADVQGKKNGLQFDVSYRVTVEPSARADS